MKIYYVSHGNYNLSSYCLRLIVLVKKGSGLVFRERGRYMGFLSAKDTRIICREAISFPYKGHRRFKENMIWL